MCVTVTLFEAVRLHPLVMKARMPSYRNAVPLFTSISRGVQPGSLHARTHALQMKLVQDGVVVALVKLIGVENSTAHRLVSGCLANLTTRRDVTWELLQANGHQVGADEWLLRRKATAVPT